MGRGWYMYEMGMYAWYGDGWCMYEMGMYAWYGEGVVCTWDGNVCMVWEWGGVCMGWECMYGMGIRGCMYGMRMYVWGRDVCSYVCMGTFKGGKEGRERSGGVSSRDNPALAPTHPRAIWSGR